VGMCGATLSACAFGWPGPSSRGAGRVTLTSCQPTGRQMRLQSAPLRMALGPGVRQTGKVQVQVQVCFTSVCGQVQPLDVALSNSVRQGLLWLTAVVRCGSGGGRVERPMEPGCSGRLGLRGHITDCKLLRRDCYISPLLSRTARKRTARVGLSSSLDGTPR
jgi:hypothetical protein